MTDFTTSNVETRLRYLEKQNRYLKRAAAVLALGVVAVLIAGAASPEPTKEPEDMSFGTLHARKVVISDQDGRERMILQLESNEPTLKMFNHRGQRQVFLGIDELWDDVAYLSVSSRLDGGDVDKQAVLAATPSRMELPGNSQLILFDAKPPQENAALRHLVRLSSGLADQKPYLEIAESSTRGRGQVNLDVLQASPATDGRRVLLETNAAEATLSGVDVVTER